MVKIFIVFIHQNHLIGGGIADELNILCDQINEIYKKHGGWRSNYFYDYVFSKKCEVKRVISELESIEILNKLVDNG